MNIRLTKVVKIHDGDRFVTALAREGRTRLHLTLIDDGGIRHMTVERDRLRDAAQVQYRGKPYPVERLVRHMRRIGRERGITEAAKAELKLATEETVT